MNPTPVQDGTIRGTIAAMGTALLAFAQIQFDVISAESAVALAPFVTGLAFILGGAYDRWVRKSSV